MIFKIFDTKGRTGKQCINYLLGWQQERGDASVISGLPSLTSLIIDSSRFKRNYVSGVINIKGKDIEENRIREIINCFQILSCAGLSENQVNFLWVKHIDKSHTELNFVVPCVSLESGRNLNFLDKKIDHYFLARFRDFIDALFNYDSPIDPINKRSLILNEKLPSESKVELQRLHNLAMRDIDSGVITSREDLFEFYIFYGYEVTSIKDSSITIADISSKKKYRLAGFAYEEGFDFSADYYVKLMEESRAFHLSRPIRLAEARQALIFSIQCRVNRQARYANSHSDDILYDRALQLIDDLFVADFEAAEPDLIITSDDEARGVFSVDSLMSDSLSWDEFDDLGDEGLELEESPDYGP